MQNIQELQAALDSIDPKAVGEDIVANAQNLLNEMGTTLEGIGDEPVEWRPPFLKLVQGTSDRGSLPKGATIGDFVIGEKKLEQPHKFIPLRIWDSRQRWDPDQTNNKVLCRSMDAKVGTYGQECRTCPFQVWKEGEGTECTKSKSGLFISADLQYLYTIQFSKSNYKMGMELESLMKRAAVLPYFRTYGLTSATSSTAKNVENFKIEVLDEKARKTPAELIPFLKALFDQIGRDRKASLEIFYENAEKNKKLALEGGQATALIEDGTSSESTGAAVKVEVDSTSVSPMAKSYSV